MSAETIKEFLVGLKFGVDKDSLQKFHEGVKSATIQAAALGAAFTAAAGAVVAQTAKMAAEMEKLYYASQRTKATAAGIQAVGYAASQLGSSFHAATSSLENLGNFLRSNPGSRGFLKSIGIDANEARDTADIMADIGLKLKAMADNGQYAQAKVYGSFLGIDEDTMRAMMSGEFTRFMSEYKDLAAKAGINLDQAAESSKGFMQQLRSTENVFRLLWDSISLALIKKLGPMIARLKDSLMANFAILSKVFSSIGAGTVKIAGLILSLLVHGAELAFRALSALDRATGGWSTKLIGLIAGWKALNLAFTLSPIGAVVTALTALAGAVVLLWNDYIVWREGGKSLIDWSQWNSEIQEAVKGLQQLWDAIKELGRVVWEVLGPKITEALTVLKTVWGETFHFLLDMIKMVTNLLLGNWSEAWEAARGAASHFATAFKAEFELLKVWFNDLVEWFVQKFGSVSNIIDKVSGVAQKVGGAVKGAAAWVGNKTKEAVGAATAWVVHKAGLKTTAEQQAAAKESYDFWISKGLTPEQASGMVANENRESSFNEKAEGDNGKAKGIFQWHKARRDAIRAATGIDIENSTHRQQLEAAYYEMTQGAEKAAGDAIRRSKTSAEAGAVTSSQYLRPGDRQGEMNERASLAEAWNKKFENMNRVQLTPSGQQTSMVVNSGAPTATISQNTNITVQGSSDPQATAGAVAQAQGSINSNLVRNTKGALL